MSFTEHSRFSTISTHTLLKLLLVLHLVSLPYTAHAQWSQTLGWGGAGYGKRSLSMLTNTVPQTPRDTCSPDPLVLSIVKRLLQAELDRLQDCKYDTKGSDLELPSLLKDYLSR